MNSVFVWLSRMFCCRGFGVQSPTDYSFVRYVINERWPYYAYDELDEMACDRITRKLGRLYFRLANWRQPNQMLHDSYEEWFRRGCRKTQFFDHTARIELLRIDSEADPASWLAQVDNDSVIVVEGICRNRQNWKRWLDSAKVTVSYDCHYCGILLFDQKRYPKHYRINF